MQESDSLELKPLKVDMEAILDALAEGGDPDVDWFLDLHSGEVQIAIDGVERASLAPGSGRRRYVPLPRMDVERELAIMKRFAEQIENGDVRGKLTRALEDKGAFGKFRAALGEHPELQTAWHETQRCACIDFVSEWLASLGFEARYDLEDGADEEGGGQRVEVGPTSRRVNLLTVLLLGAPEGKTELIGGRVHRVFVADSPAEARAAFDRIARELCAYYGVDWRLRVSGQSDRLALEEAELVRDDHRVELSVRISPEIWQAFRPPGG